MLDGGGQGHRQHVEDGGRVEAGRGESAGFPGHHPGNPQPGRLPDRREVHHAHEQGEDIAGDNAAQDGNQAEKLPAEHDGGDGRGERAAGQNQRTSVRGARGIKTAGHADGDRCQLEADDHDDGTRDDRWQKPVQQFAAAQAGHQAEQQVHQARAEQGAVGGARTVFGHGELDRRNEGKGTRQKDRHRAARQRMEKQGAGTGGEQSHRRIEAGQQRHQDQGPEGHKQHLNPQHQLPDRCRCIHPLPPCGILWCPGRESNPHSLSGNRF